MNTLTRWTFGFLALVSIVDVSSAPATPVDYLRDIRSLLRNKCFSCHGPRKQESGLQLDAGNLALTGGDNGAAIMPGDSGTSLLMARVSSSDEDERMPPAGALGRGEGQLLHEPLHDRVQPPRSNVLHVAVDL